jgi:hypothetical protein
MRKRKGNLTDTEILEGYYSYIFDSVLDKVWVSRAIMLPENLLSLRFHCSIMDKNLRRMHAYLGFLNGRGKLYGFCSTGHNYGARWSA